MAVAPARTSTSWPRIARSGSFCVNVLSEDQEELCVGFAASGGPKFDGVAWHPAPGTGSPVIEGSLAWVDCDVALVHDAGDHELILGHVRDIGVGEGSPLLFYRSQFRYGGPRPGTTRGVGAMPKIIESDVIRDVIIVEPDAHGDERGRFVETYRRSWFPLGREMIQGNRSTKQAGAVVGLHYHLHQSDYWYVLAGTARVVLHDLRQGSPTDGATLSLDLSGDHDRGLFIPPGVAHGFASLTDLTLWYLVDGYYNPEDELGVAWDDPAIGGDWGVTDPVLSARDQENPLRSELPPGRQPYLGLRT